MTTPWWRDPEQHAAMRAKYGSSQAAARALQGDPATRVAPRNAQQWWRKFLDAGSVVSSVPDPRASAGIPTDPDGDTLEAHSNIGDTHATLVDAANPRPTALRTAEDLMRDSGMDPDEWDHEFERTEWDGLAGDGKVTTLYRVKVRATKRPEAMFAQSLPAEWLPPPPEPIQRDHEQPLLIPLLADPHFPNVERALFAAFLQWCRDFEPDGIWCLGDAANNSPFGRHGVNRRPDLNVSVNEAVWSTTEGLLQIAHAAPNAWRRLLFGNHDYWLEKRLLEVFPKLAELRRYEEDDPYVSIAKVLKLDDIGWAYNYTLGEYHDVNVEIVPGLVGMHGTRTGPHGGALKEITRWEGVSIVQGHDHTLGMTAVRYRRPGGGHVQRYGISAGSAARADLGYDPAHNVGQGWPVVSLWPDGRWHVDFALYDPTDGSTTWRDWYYKGPA